MRIGSPFLGRLGDRGRATATELGDRQLRLAEARLARGVEAQAGSIQLDALLEPDCAGLELLDGSLERSDELVERLARELLVGEDRQLRVVDHEISSSEPVR